MLDTILFVDDDTITLMLCKMVITRTSFSNEIITSKNGEEALKYFENLKIAKKINIPKLVFLDLNMPVMNGWEFLDSFSSNAYSDFHDTKIIILSSTIDPADLERSKKYPMVIDFISKPITKEKVELIKKKFEL
jgi:CheY-like chemotaxis protein